MILAFGDQYFVKEMLESTFSEPIAATGLDMSSVGVQLKQFPNARDVVIGFRHSLDFTVQYANLYRDRRFFLVLEPTEINVEVYKKALANGITVVDRKRMKEVLGYQLGRRSEKIIDRSVLDYEIIHYAERKMVPNIRALKNQVITFTSPGKGGVGKTTISSALAVDIAAWAKERKIDYSVCFVDGDVEGARTGGLLLGIQNVAQTLKIWADMKQRPKWSELNNLLVQHESGLWVLPAPQTFADSIRTPMTSQLAEDVIQTLKENFDMVIVDVGNFLKNDMAVRSMQLSSKVYIVFHPRLPVLQLLEQLTSEKTLGELEVDLAKVKLIVNEDRPAYKYSSEDIFRKFNLPVEVILPEDEHVRKAEESGEGSTVPILYPKSPFALGIKTLARLALESELYQGPQEEKGKGWFMNRLKKKISMV